MRRPPRWASLVALVAVLAWAAEEALQTMGALKAANGALRTDLDSARAQIAVTLAANTRLADSTQALTRVAAQARAHADSVGRQALALEHQADQLRAERARREPLGTVTPTDSIGYYRDLLEASDREADFLRLALARRLDELAAKDEEGRAKDRQLTLLEAQVRADSSALAHAQPALSRAGDALAHSEPRCRLARVIPCPSRTVSFLGGAGAVVLTYTLLHQD